MVDFKKVEMTFARALFDNVAEMPRELSFKKGDILTVHLDNYENNPEWWVCSLRNLKGLAPANRLEAMSVLFQSKPRLQNQISSLTYDELPEQSSIDHRYFNMQGNKAPSSCDETYSTYQLPIEDVYTNPLSNTAGNSNETDEQSVYQIPSDHNFYETYSNTLEATAFKTNSNTLEDNTMKPVNSKEAIFNEYYDNRTDYSDSFSDTTSNSRTDSSLNSANQFSMVSSDSGDFKSLQKDSATKLLISPEEAIVRYRQLQSDITVHCNKVIEFAKAKWKSEEVLKVTVNSIRQCFVEFYDNLVILMTFVTGVYQNSLNCPDVNLSKKIAKHVSPLHDSKQTIKDALDKLHFMNWEPDKIATSVRLAVKEGADALGLVVASARNVLINTRSLSVTINGNASILFPKLLGAYYHGDDIEPSLKTTINVENNDDSPNVQNVLRLFGSQVQSQVDLVNETVDDFMNFVNSRSQDLHFQETITSNSKFVIRSATQLVCIAKNLADTQLKSVPCEKVEDAGNRLCDSLKTMINITKLLISERRWTADQKDQLLRQLRTIKVNANNFQRIVVNAIH